MHVISASRRTDIPAFHASWFMNRVRAGSARVVSPFGQTVFEVSLVPADVIAIVFWTKNAGPLLPRLDELTDRGHCFTFLYTINNYPESLEPNVPELTRTLEVLAKLGGRRPLPVIRWRYDTIVLTRDMDRAWHLQNFRMLCRLLSPFTRECIFSFCDYYRKTIRNMEQRVPDHLRPDTDTSRRIAEEMAAIAAEWGLTLSSCAHDLFVTVHRDSRTIRNHDGEGMEGEGGAAFTPAGTFPHRAQSRLKPGEPLHPLAGNSIGKARCIDPSILAHVVDSPVRRQALAELKPAPSRKECGCYASRDIGAYDTCGHGCVYCYANTNPELARRNLVRMRPDQYCLDARGNGDLATP